MHAVTLTKYHNYPSKLIIKHANILSKVIKSHNVNLYRITPYNKCTELKYMYAQGPYCKSVASKRLKIPV